jgi:uncharacterized membrane protein
VLVVGGSLVLVYRPSSTSWAAQKKGILLAVGAAVFFSLNSCFDRLAVQQASPVLSGFAVSLLSASFLLPYVLRRQEHLRALWFHQSDFLLRGFLEVAFMVAKLYALQTLDAPAVAAIQRISLILSIVGGRMFFKEQDFVRRLAAGVLILAGVFLIAWLEL